jgi:intracellular sulfur oxidation DsrE/DsrF family protein
MIGGQAILFPEDGGNKRAMAPVRPYGYAGFVLTFPFRFEEIQGKPIMRKSIIGAAVALALAATGLAAVASDPVGPDKVVYHVNNTDLQASDALRNIGNHLEVNPKARIVVVTHARGVDMLFKGAKDKNGSPYSARISELKLQGVQFDICQITLRNRKLEQNQFVSEATFVPSGVAEITRLQQREGYAYLRP